MSQVFSWPYPSPADLSLSLWAASLSMKAFLGEVKEEAALDPDELLMDRSWGSFEVGSMILWETVTRGGAKGVRWC